MDSPHVELMRAFYEALAHKDEDAAKKMLHPEARWFVPGHNKLAGVYTGADSILTYFHRFHELSEGTVTTKVTDVYVGQTGVVVHAHTSGKREHRWLRSSYCLRLVMEEGMIREGRIFNEDQHEFDAFWH